ncbi:MAG TPA: biopolymer transporter ExbD [Verrucomicrobiae bacterium]|nr:biopolymer transporter ExbD [Verrucomicrobiae bacterium]
MQFTTRKRRQAPAVIIISLIDILIVLLIFMMVTTSFRQVPALRINLPQSTAVPKPGATAIPPMIVTIAKAAPFLYLNRKPVTLTKLQEEFTAAASRDTNTSVAIHPDKEAPVQELIDVLSAATAARIKTQVGVYTKVKGP